MNAVVKPQENQALTESATLLSVISRVAADPSADVEKMERLLAMHREMQQQQAEAEFNSAMARVQSRMGRIGTDKTNSQTHSDYATYGKLDRVLRPIYTSEGFALSFGTDPIPVESMVRVTCHVSHTAGFTRKYTIDMPADGKGAKGNDVMTKTHATGSATQYGMRYLLKMIFNVAIGDEDDDGNAADAPLPEKDQAWITSVEQVTDHAKYKEMKADMLADYGGNASSIPAPVRHAFNVVAAATKPKD